MNKKLFFINSVILLGSPVIILAQVAVPFPSVNPAAINNLLSFIINLIWLVFAAFAVVMFIVAGILFLSAQGEPGKVDQARKAVIWGVVGIGVALISVSIPFIVKVALGV